jgi:dTDP-4-amino-4,6-dideoxygalactose transaminase
MMSPTPERPLRDQSQRAASANASENAPENRPRTIPITCPAFGPDELERVRECLESGWVTQGPLTRRFEESFARRHAVRHALATTSCTAALHLATAALELGPGDEVIVPAFTWVTSAHSAEYVGARAVFADVNPDTFNLDPAALRAAVTPRTKAVVVVHLFGLAAEMHEILAVARRYGLAVIEDAACAVGTEYDGRPVGGWGELGCFSFHPRKVITTGEGGMVTTDDDELAARVKPLRNHGATGHPGFSTGSARPYTMGRFDRLGYNLRLSDIQAAVGVAQMERLDGLLAERRGRALRYHEILADVADLALPVTPPLCGHTYQSFVVRFREGGQPRRNAVMDYLADRGVQTRPGTHAVHRLGYYSEKYGLRPEQFPAACAAEDLSMTLPIFPGMTDDDQDYVAQALRTALAAKSVGKAA